MQPLTLATKGPVGRGDLELADRRTMVVMFAVNRGERRIPEDQ